MTELSTTHKTNISRSTKRRYQDPSERKKTSEANKGLRWWWNPVTDEYQFSSESFDDPWIQGKSPKKTTNAGKKWWWNPETCEKQMTADELPSPWVRGMGPKVAKRSFEEFQEWVSTAQHLLQFQRTLLLSL